MGHVRPGEDLASASERRAKQSFEQGGSIDQNCPLKIRSSEVWRATKDTARLVVSLPSDSATHRLFSASSSSG